MFKDKKILVIIPARGGSKGVPKKNIKKLNNIPLIGYTILAAKQSNYVDRVIVSTDTEEIKNVSASFGAEVPYLRNAILSSDTASSVDVVNDMLNFLKIKENYVPDYVCLLQCTSPFRSTVDIDNSIEKLLDSNFDGIISISEVDENPYWTNILKNDKLEYFIEEGKKITRRQDLPKVYSYNGAIYLIKTSIFLKQKTFETDNITGYIMSKESSIDIDTMFDFKIAEILMRDLEK